MLALVRSLAVGRLSAMLIAFALSGVPRLAVARPAGVPARCACPAHQRQRACPCGGCHKGGAAHAKVQAHRGAHDAPEEGRDDCASMKGGCSMPEAPAAAAPGATEVFTLSGAAVLTSPDHGARIAPPTSSPLAAPHVPETPPPRRA